MHDVPHAAVVHEQQTHSCTGIQSTEGRTCDTRHPAAISRHRSGFGVDDPERYRLLQGTVTKECVVSGTLSSRWGGGKPGGDVRPGPPERESCSWRMVPTGYNDSRDQGAQVRLGSFGR